MNKCFFTGRTTKDSELRYSQGQNPLAIATVSIAVEDGYGDNKRTSFFELVLFGARAEAFNKYVIKGTKVALECHAQQDTWKDKDTGKQRSKVTFIVDNWEFAQSKDQAPATQKQEQYNENGFTPLEEEELPFK